MKSHRKTFNKTCEGPVYTLLSFNISRKIQKINVKVKYKKKDISNLAGYVMHFMYIDLYLKNILYENIFYFLNIYLQKKNGKKIFRYSEENCNFNTYKKKIVQVKSFIWQQKSILYFLMKQMTNFLFLLFFTCTKEKVMEILSFQN